MKVQTQPRNTNLQQGGFGRVQSGVTLHLQNNTRILRLNRRSHFIQMREDNGQRLKLLPQHQQQVMCLQPPAEQDICDTNVGPNE